MAGGGKTEELKVFGATILGFANACINLNICPRDPVQRISSAELK